MGNLVAPPKTVMIPTYVSANDCHQTEVTLRGTVDLGEFKREVWNLVNTGKIIKEDRDYIEKFSDGY
jgi:hypothetical protein